MGNGRKKREKAARQTTDYAVCCFYATEEIIWSVTVNPGWKVVNRGNNSHFQLDLNFN